MRAFTVRSAPREQGSRWEPSAERIAPPGRSSRSRGCSCSCRPQGQWPGPCRASAPGKPGFMAFSDFVNGLVLGGVGLLTLFLAVWLWRRGRGARVFAATWVVVAGLFSWIMLWRPGNVLWAIWIMIFEPDAWSVRWPYFSWNAYLGRLDDVFFWLSGIVAVGALLVACLLLAGWITARAEGARSG